ncbi:MAG: ferritin-like domain-containing protein [Polyangiaceae bacterium]
MASETYHEPFELLSAYSKEFHRAIVSLIEELEAIDWYQQRADVCNDPELRAVLVHNKNEEIEHAMMTLEWLRRRDADIDVRLRTYVLSEGAITEIEARVEHGAEGGAAGGGGAAEAGAVGTGAVGTGAVGAGSGLGIGSLRGGTEWTS